MGMIVVVMSPVGENWLGPVPQVDLQGQGGHRGPECVITVVVMVIRKIMMNERLVAGSAVWADGPPTLLLCQSHYHRKNLGVVG